MGDVYTFTDFFLLSLKNEICISKSKFIPIPFGTVEENWKKYIDTNPSIID